MIEEHYSEEAKLLNSILERAKDVDKTLWYTKYATVVDEFDDRLREMDNHSITVEINGEEILYLEPRALREYGEKPEQPDKGAEEALMSLRMSEEEKHLKRQQNKRKELKNYLKEDKMTDRNKLLLDKNTGLVHKHNRSEPGISVDGINNCGCGGEYMLSFRTAIEDNSLRLIKKRDAEIGIWELAPCLEDEK